MKQLNKQHNFELTDNTVLWRQGWFVLPIDILDEDNMISDRADALASQASIKAYVDSVVTWALVPQGVRDPAANNPVLTSGVGTVWHLYIASWNGTTLLDGNNNWTWWDILFFANWIWNRVPNSIELTWWTIIGTLSDQADLQLALDNKEAIIAAWTTTQYWRWDKTRQTLDKAAVWLANVDNTSDANKPVSTATQTSLDGKEDVSNKATDFTTVNDTLYPTVEAVKEVTDTKLNIQAWVSTSTTIPFLVDTIYGTYATPLVWNITLTTAGAIDWVTNDLFHNDTTIPTFTNATSVNGTYTTWSVNAISLQYKWGAFIVYIQTLT